ncbi:S-adenosylmethionine sensor upstream of TORC1 isoform X2 [Haemaphysalis longicornis]
MTREDQQELVAVIRGVHEKLRLDYQTNGDGDRVWRDHCRDSETRRKYAESMLQLATSVWPYKDRIEWCYQTLRWYFFEGGLEHSLQRHHRKMGLPSSDSVLEQARRELALASGKVRLLDVGSCYNPFGAYSDIDALAIDLTPATKDVVECDFLKLRVVPGPIEVSDRTPRTTPLEALQEGSFEAVVFCLVLEYLPSCVQRWSFCRKAAALLRLNGLLFIVTPDSKHQQRNAAMIASWRKALEHIGLLRIRYEKRQHLHCMAFRKEVQQTMDFGADDSRAADDVLKAGLQEDTTVCIDGAKQVEPPCDSRLNASREVLSKSYGAACIRNSKRDADGRVADDILGHGPEARPNARREVFRHSTVADDSCKAELERDEVRRDGMKQVESSFCNARTDASTEVLGKSRGEGCVRDSGRESEVRLGEVDTVNCDGDVGEEEDIAQLMYIPQDSRDYVALFTRSVIEDRTSVEDESLRDVFAELPGCEDL